MRNSVGLAQKRERDNGDAGANRQAGGPRASRSQLGKEGNKDCLFSRGILIKEHPDRLALEQCPNHASCRFAELFYLHPGTRAPFTNHGFKKGVFKGSVHDAERNARTYSRNSAKFP